MIRAIAICAIFLTGIVVAADEVPPNVKRLIEVGEIRRKERLDELEGGFNVLKARLHEQTRGQGGLGTGVPANAIGQDHAIKAMQRKLDDVLGQIEEVKARPIFYPNITMKSLQVDDIGILTDSFGVGVTARVSRIIDARNMIVTIDTRPLWLEASTKNLKAGRTLQLDMPLEVTGTTTHNSVGGGSKEIFVVQRFRFPDVDARTLQAMKETRTLTR